MLTEIEKGLLETIADMKDGQAEGAVNIRVDGKKVLRNSTDTIRIESKTDKDGIDIYVAAGSKNGSVHIPVVLTETGFKDKVYNDFFIGEGAEVDIVAGCGINNCGCDDSQHDGIHTFYVGKNAKVTYSEKHYGEGTGTGKRILNPQTIIYLEEGASMTLDLSQIGGVDDTTRTTRATLAAGAKLYIRERLLTEGSQQARTDFEVFLDGEDSGVDLISRSVAKGNSHQAYRSRIVGNTRCTGHSECDAIIADNGTVTAAPELTANSGDAALIHEAAIGKIAGEQLLKLRTLGLTEEEAEAKIVAGFLK